MSNIWTMKIRSPVTIKLWINFFNEDDNVIIDWVYQTHDDISNTYFHQL